MTPRRDGIGMAAHRECLTHSRVAMPPRPGGRVRVSRVRPMSSVFSQAADRLRSSAAFRDLCSGRPGLRGAPVPVAAWLFELLGDLDAMPQIVVVPGESDALSWIEAARLFGAAADVVYFPSPALTPYQESETSLQIRAQEAIALDRLFEATRPTLVCTPRALFRAVPDEAAFRAAVHSIRAGGELDVDALLVDLVRRGYRRSELVAEVGTFAVRGGLIDLFGPGMDDPVRLDLFGDQVESIRAFDLASQRSGASLEEVRILPLSLLPAGPERAGLLADRLEQLGVETSGEAGERLAMLRSGEGFPGWENYLPALEDELRGLGDLESLRPRRVVCLDPALLLREIEHHQEVLEDEFDSRRAAGRLAVASADLLLPFAAVRRLIDEADHRIGELGPVTRLGSPQPPGGAAASPGSAVSGAVDFGATPTDMLVGQLPRLPREVDTARARGDRVVFVVSEGNEERLREMLLQRQIDPAASGVELVAGSLQRGFRLPAAGITVFSDLQLFPLRTPRRSRSRLRPFLSGMRDLKVGEFVVHEEHGIGQFIGMRSLSAGGSADEAAASQSQLPPTLRELRRRAGSATEVMEIEYADGRTLLLPLHRLDLVQRYSGVEGLSPRLDKLGGSSWSRKKSRVRRGLQKLAVDLLELYAARKIADAPRIGPDSDEQNLFELAFEHTETEDQLVAIEEIKRDLESGRPMDRLLCGDVGFGKTEVAMRAAFKTVDNGYQVALLAPTTILAAQHLQTLRSRFAEFPVEIDMISRFRTPAEVREIRQRVKAGEVDILIGTHRLLSQDLGFAKLGLLVIDEEQRFGVGHKEKLKALRRDMHVLSLSATPVPRTLQMSLAGVRDLSTIESPPKDRMAVETQVVPFSTDLVRDVIEFELERGGQIYFVHNRVEDIEQVSAQLQELVPGLRMTVGHGQLDERALSERMQAFKEGRYDLLLATTIIENGIDIPSVNTMIVHHAERYGLAQLYQLRGRVGRSDQLAFCYLTIPADRVLTEEARRRLRAIEEFTELGSGFRIAARDLEIRGAGDLLGAEQSGHISDLGIDTYLKMLEETVRELQGEEVATAVSAQIDLPIAMSIPEDYVAEVNLRMDLYRRLAAGEDEPSEILEEMEDRFGPPPEEVRSLVRAATLKQLAERLRVQSIVSSQGSLVIRMRRDARVDVERLIELVAERGDASFSPSGVLTLDRVPGRESLAVAQATLQRIEAPRAEAVA
ncbi:MAG: transcription-repair coupling factor [Acidobacteria bacterium]|nr:MAG: transcription-repair coupling factor [Acidobacteriota bacterium]